MALYFVPPSRERTESRGGRVGVSVEVAGVVYRGGFVHGPLSPEAALAIREAGLEGGLVEADRRPGRHPDEDW
jgi:hypothetical protein